MDINRIGKGGLGQAIGRIFGLVDPNAVATVAPELMPTTSPWERPEFWALTGGNLCVGTASIGAGGAATRVVVQLVNPTNSGMILITDEVNWGDNLSWVYVGMNLISALNQPADLDSYHRDGRRAPGGNVIRGQAGRIRGSAITTVGLITPQQYIGVIARQHAIDEAWVIPPGFALQVAQSADNQAMTVNFIWREKPVSDSEQLTF